MSLDISDRVILIGGVVAGLLIAWPAFNLDLYVRVHPTTDWLAYYRAVARWQAGAPLYVDEKVLSLPTSGEGQILYLYPPYVLLFIFPFTILGPKWGGEVFALGGALTFAIAIATLLRQYGWISSWRSFVLAVLFALMFSPVYGEVHLGQITTWLVAAVVAAVIGAERAHKGLGSRGIAGALLMLAVTVKPHFAPMLAYTLTDRREFVSACMTGIGLAILSVAVGGISGIRGYVTMLTSGSKIGPARYEGWFHRFEPFYILDPFHQVTHLFVLCATIVVVFAAVRWARWRTIAALGLAVIPIASVESYTDSLLFLLPAIALLVADSRSVNHRQRVPWLIGAVGLLHMQIPVMRVLPDLAAGVGTLAGIGTETSYTLASLGQPALWGTVIVVGVAGQRVVRELAYREERGQGD